MAPSIEGSSGGDPMSGFKSQIETLKADPNATDAFKQQLDKWLQSVQAASGAAPQAPGPATQVPGAGAAARSPAAPPPLADAPSANFTASKAPSDTGSGQLPPELSAFAEDIKAASAKTGVSQTEISAVIWDESRGKVGASATNGGNGRSDTGLMQINPGTFGELQSKHPELQGKSLADPATNILAGAFLLADYKQQFGSAELAERAYNSGPGSVNKSDPNMTTTGLGDPDYIRKVSTIKAAIESGQSLPA